MSRVVTSRGMYCCHDYRHIPQVIESMANDALRTICVAYKDVTDADQPNWEDEDGTLRGLTCISIVGIEDPVRPEVRLTQLGRVYYCGGGGGGGGGVFPL